MWSVPWYTIGARHALTRVLCWITLVSWVAVFLGWGSLVLLLAAATHGVEVLSLSDFSVAFLVALLVHMGAVVGLWVWRSCYRCGFHLYQFWNPIWLVGSVARFNEAPRAPHGLAESVAGCFYGLGGFFSKATRGVAHCVWCGHPDKVQEGSSAQ